MDNALRRCIELINKTNQFNSTGLRWKSNEIVSFLKSGEIFYFDAIDSNVPHGIVGVILIEKSVISQFVMSCRVIGRGIELGVLRELLRHNAFEDGIQISFKSTERNLIFASFLTSFGNRIEKDKSLYRLAVQNGTLEHTDFNFNVIK
jgi:FkbH-like protein